MVTATTAAPTNALSLVPMKIFKTQADLDLQINFLIHHVSPVPVSMTESLYDKLKRVVGSSLSFIVILISHSKCAIQRQHLLQRWRK